MAHGTNSEIEALTRVNQSIDEYFEKFRTYESLRCLIEKLMVPIQEPQKKTMEEISFRLDELEGCFTELGYLDEGGRFDLESYQRMKVLRRIADGKIRSLDGVPEMFRDELEYAFDDDANTDDGLEINGEFYRETEVIRDDMERTFDWLACEIGPARGLGVREGFEQYLIGMKKVPEPLQQLISNLNELWLDYKDAARAVAYHFRGGG